MKKFFIIIILMCQFLLGVNAESMLNYTNSSYIGTEFNAALNGSIPFLLVIANPKEQGSGIQYIPIGKMIYERYKDKYDFCVINSDKEENREYMEYLNPQEFPAVYVINPKNNLCVHIDNKYHNAEDIKRILDNLLTSEDFNR